MSQRDQLAGAQYADRTWDQILRHRGELFFIAFITRIMALYGSATSREHVIQVLDAVRTGVLSLTILAEKNPTGGKPS